jgi:hypothetical protein
VRSRVVLAVAVAVAAVAACASDDDAAGPTDVQVTATTTAASDAEADAISGEEICERLTIASVAADTGLDVVRAIPDDDATPQCAYEYANDTGGVSNLTVASMRSEDVGGLTGSDAFDFVVRINESIAGDGAETHELSAGDNAIRLSGASLHVGVVQLGDRVLTLIIPVDDANSDGVDGLIATMATTLG